MGQGTLTTPYTNVSHNAMYLGPTTLLGSGKGRTLSSSGVMQNPMYAALGDGRKLATPPKSAVHYDQLKSPAPTKEGDVTLEDLEKEDPHYEQLEPHLLITVPTEYQKLSETSFEKTEGTPSNGAYASLYNVPTGRSPSPPQTPPRPPQLMPPTVGGARPENPYIVGPRQTSTNDVSRTPTSLTTPEKSDLAKEYEGLDKKELEKH